MSGFVKRNSVKTVNPAGGINPAQAPNVGQYGWTTGDSSNVNQIIEYVNMCKEYAERAKDSADYVELRFEELQRFMDFIETVYNELKPIIDEIQPIYQDIIFRHEDTITRHIDVIRLHNLVTADKVEINSIKEDAIKEITVIKQDTIAEANNIIEYGIKETEAVKELAVIEANRAKTEADRSAAEAVKSANSATASAGSATTSGTEAAKAAASAKEAADIAEELRKGQVYRGTWNIETNNAFPPKPDTNSVWDITLAESSTSFVFAGETWYWGDRLLFLKDEDKFSQIESGSTVISVNGKGGAVTLDAKDVGAIDRDGDTLTAGTLAFAEGNVARLKMNTSYMYGANDSIMLRDHGNGNVTLSGGLSSAGVAGDLYLGYNGSASGTAGYNTRTVRLQQPLTWAGSTTIVNDQGVNSEFMYGPIRTEKDSTNVWHTIVGGTDTVNRGRTIVAGGECGKAIYDNTSSGAEQVHIGGDDTNGINFHTGLQNGWGGSTHHRYWFNQGNLFTQPMSGGTTQKYYHSGAKPTPTELGVVNKAGDTSIGSLTLAPDKVLNATLIHQRGYMSIFPYSTGYGLDGASGNRLRMYYKEHNNGNPSDLSRGLVLNSTDSSGTSHDMSIWIGTNKVYHQGFKPTSADIGAVPLNGSVPMTNALYTTGIDFTKDDGVVRDKDGHVVVQTTKQFGANLFGSDQKQTYLVFKDNLIARKGVTDYKVYHEGFKPVLADLLGSGASTSNTVILTVPPGVVSGKYYPILFNGTTGFPDVQISTATAAASSSMNNCSFKGQVLSGGWSDQGRYATGNFRIYSAEERAIHSIVGASESDNHYVIYVEARAFPVTVTTSSRVTVTSTGKDTTYGTSVYKAGISGMTASGDYGTKTSLILDFVRGEGFYGGTVRSSYIDATGINASDRINVLDYNNNGAFITRRPGKPSYSMMGQDSNGNTMLGLGVDTSGYSSYLKVSGSTLGYSASGSTEHRVYHEGFKPSLGELGGIASTGGTMTGALNIDVNTPAPLTVKGGTKVGLKFTASGRDRYLGINSEGFLTFSGGSDYDTGNKVYHSSHKPTAADVGAIATSGGRMTGKLQIYGASSQLELIENDQAADKVWRFEAQNNNLDFTESGVATRLRLKAGGGATLSGQLDVGGHLVLGSGNILKFPTANYATGAQMYARDGGQFGSDFVLNTGGNMILGAGESGTALASLMTSGSEHAYLAADGDVYVMPKCNTIAERITHKFGADGNVTFNAAATAARTYYGATDSYIARSGANMYVAANAANGKVYIEGKANPIARVNGTDYTIYHSGNLPSFGDLAAGKAIGSSTQISASSSDLNDFKTPGVYHQPGNAGASAGLNYPEPLAGSLVVYTAAGVVQEYRIYNSSKLYRRAQYSTGAWTPWTKDYNSGIKPTAAELGVVPQDDITTNATFGKIPKMSGSGVLDVGRYIDMHLESAKNDYDARFEVSAAGSNYNLNLHGAHMVMNRGLTINNSTGPNMIGTSGGYIRSNTKDVMSMDGKAYSFVTATLDAHLCSNAYWDGKSWNKYDAAKGSSYVVVNNDGHLNMFTSSPTSTNPQEIRTLNIDKVGNASFTGNITGANISGSGNISTINGASFLSSGIFRTTRALNPMVEWHSPGKYAYIQYINASGSMVLSTSNGAGTEAAVITACNGSVFQATGKFQTNTNLIRSWNETGKSGLYVDNSQIAVGEGNLQAICSMYTYLPNHYYADFYFGVLHGNSWQNTEMNLTGYNASNGERMTWSFRNSGTLQNSQGRWRIGGDGGLVASIYGGAAIHEWVQRNFAPISDGNLKTVLGESTESALDKVSQMKFHKYVWKDTEATKQLTKRDVKINSIGLIAQEVEAIDSCYTRDIEVYDEHGAVAESTKTLDTANLLALALKAIQELEAKVATLEEKLNGMV